MIQVLREQVWPLPAFGVVEQVRLVTEEEPEEFRIPDALVVDLRPNGGDRLVVLAVEVKLTMGDYLSEIANLSKSAQARAISDEFWIVVRAPYTKVIPKVGRQLQLPVGWGLAQVVGGGRVEIVVHPVPRVPAARLSVEHVRALLRRAHASTARADVDFGAPTAPIVLRLGGDNVVLACDHTTIAPRLKRLPRLPCFKCASGAPPDLDSAIARIGRATGEELTVLSGAVTERVRMVGGAA